jgi:hypothetical protein
MKRYAVTIDLYIHAENDSDAIKQADKIAEKLRSKEDNHASVLEIWENKFGSIDHRRVILCDHCDEEGIYETNIDGADVECICNCGKYESLKSES